MRCAPEKGRPRLEDRARTIEARKPWLELEMSRRTWYRRLAEQRKGQSAPFARDRASASVTVEADRAPCPGADRRMLRLWPGAYIRDLIFRHRRTGTLSRKLN